MSVERFAGPGMMVRMLVLFGCIGICAFVGCGNLGGCDPSGIPIDNDNTPVGNENDNTSANDNVGGNDNAPVGNDNTPDNGNDNIIIGNGNTSNGNGNTNPPGNDNVVSNGNANGNDNVSNTNANANANANGNTSTNLPDLQVSLGPDGSVSACQTVLLDVTVTPPNTGTVTWSGSLNRVAGFTTLANGDATFTVPLNTSLDPQTLSFTATASATGFDPGAHSINLTLAPATPLPGITDAKSSGAAQPGDLVTLSFDQTVPNGTTAVWVQSATDPSTSQVPLTRFDSNRQARFIAPDGGSTTSKDLHFNLTTCQGTTPIGRNTLTVPVQVASVTLSLPATIRLNDPLEMNVVPITVVTGGPADLLALYTTEEPLPPGVALSFDEETTSMLTVTSGDPGEIITITVQIFGTAGLLAEDSDTIMIGP